MVIQLKKFGTTLVSHQAGKEALAAFQSILETLTKEDNLEIDFDGVITFTPSWGDEFLTPLQKKYNARFFLRNAENPSVQATLNILEEIGRIKFNVIK